MASYHGAEPVLEFPYEVSLSRNMLQRPHSPSALRSHAVTRPAFTLSTSSQLRCAVNDDIYGCSPRNFGERARARVCFCASNCGMTTVLRIAFL